MKVRASNLHSEIVKSLGGAKAGSALKKPAKATDFDDIWDEGDHGLGKSGKDDNFDFDFEDKTTKPAPKTVTTNLGGGLRAQTSSGMRGLGAKQGDNQNMDAFGFEKSSEDVSELKKMIQKLRVENKNLKDKLSVSESFAFDNRGSQGGSSFNSPGVSLQEIMTTSKISQGKVLSLTSRRIFDC